MNTHSGFTHRFGLSARIASTAFGAALTLLISSSALADAAQEVKTAAQHAGFAAEASDIAGVQMHLHHTLNCLVGPDGEGFDADEMNPCQDMGKGAIPDTTDDAQKQTLEKAAEQVRTGLDSDDLDEARQAAKDANEMLESQAM
ncbi:hypothetical protein FGL86_11510 [Pistricoccus aurantiacus]|uniref:Uncharacterized protein n=1 Tax=Pistricoccus aurantiacus TaxID=1883414 RepID=A0A5B8SVQ7_9GAMM|nr:hypothetical protein [Pistricoccus aurantiacus]QEA39635.1 hypothetical protein FGL86_11510 [Pistricoccus aurantiacus]